MDCNIKLGRYSNLDYRIISEWIAKHSANKERLVVALQFSISDVEYAPRIQYHIEKQVNSIVSKSDDSKNKCNIRFFILSDIVNPTCCLDALNIKKSHSDLVIHFGYSCYHNISNSQIPVYFAPSDDDYFEISESSTLLEIVQFLFNQLKDRLNDQKDIKTKRINVILSFQGILKRDAQTILLDEISKSGLIDGNSCKELCLYHLSPINITDHVQLDDSEYICDLLFTKIGHDQDLKLENLEMENFKACDERSSNESVIFFHFISKNIEYSNLPNSFLERIILRYNQIFQVFLCQFNESSSCIEINSNALNRLNNIISQRFISIEKAKSIHSKTSVAFVITPGITSLDWKLIEYFKRHDYRLDTDNEKKIQIETHIILLTGVSEVKLRNFPDIDIFCFFGCYEYFLTHIIKNLNLKTPIILTPFEYLVFLGIKEWTTCYLNVSDLKYLTDLDLSSIALSDSQDSEFEEEFSKISIKDSEELHNNNTLSTKSPSFSLQNIDKKTKKLLASLSSIKNDHKRSYFGLNPLENTDRIPTITQGRDGIASMYKSENL